MCERGAHVFLTKVLIYLMQQPEIKNEAQKNEEKEDAFNTIAHTHTIFFLLFLVIDVSNISFLTNHYFLFVCRAHLIDAKSVRIMLRY